MARYAIQMAKQDGATVITTVSSEEKAAYAHAAGADHVVNYKVGDTTTEIMDLTGGVDRVVELEFGANINVTQSVIKPGGVIAAYGSAASATPALPFMPLMFKNVTLRMILVYLLDPAARTDVVAGLTRLLEQGALTHSVAETFDLVDVAKAHKAVEAAAKMGSVVVRL